MTDSELIRRALQNPDDYALTIEQYEKSILRYIQKISQLSREDAEDIAQRVFLKAYNHLNDFDPQLKLANWLLRIARNEVIDFWRQHKARPQVEELNEEMPNGLQSAETNAAEKLDRKFLRTKVQKVLELLKPEYREILYLLYFEEKNYEEISDILRRPPGTVAALISRAKKAFSEVARRLGISDHFISPS